MRMRVEEVSLAAFAERPEGSRYGLAANALCFAKVLIRRRMKGVPCGELCAVDGLAFWQKIGMFAVAFAPRH